MDRGLEGRAAAARSGDVRPGVPGRPAPLHRPMVEEPKNSK